MQFSFLHLVIRQFYSIPFFLTACSLDIFDEYFKECTYSCCRCSKGQRACTIPRHWPDFNTFIKWSIYPSPSRKISIGNIISIKYWMIPKEKYAVSGALRHDFSFPLISEHNFKDCVIVWDIFQHSGRKTSIILIFEQSLYQQCGVSAFSWLLIWKIFTCHVKVIGHNLSEFLNGWKFVKHG